MPTQATVPAQAVPAAEDKRKNSERILDSLAQAKTREDALSTEVASLKGRLEKLEVREGPPHTRVVSVPGTGTDDPGKFSFHRAIVGIIGKRWEHAPYEKEVFDEARKQYLGKASSLANDESLGFLVPSQVMLEQIVPLLRPKLVLEKMKVEMLVGLTGSPVEIPRETAGGTFVWVGESTAPTSAQITDIKVDMMRLRPHKGIVVTKLSNTLLRLNGSMVDQLVRRTIVEDMRHGLQKAFFNGTGADGQPLGVLNAVGINTFAVAGFVPTDLDAILSEIEQDDGDSDDMSWVFHSRVMNKIRTQTYDQAGAPIDSRRLFFTDGSPINKIGPMLLGFPFWVTNDMPIVAGAPDTGDILLGRWPSTKLALWASMEILATKEGGDAFLNDETWVRIVSEADVGFALPKAICAGTGVEV